MLAATKPKTKRLSVSSNGTEANGRTDDASISANGRFVAFEGYADNLVPNDGNLVADIFVYDRKTKQTKRVSVSSSGEEADAFSIDPVISASGRFVAFHSAAPNLVPNDGNDDTDVFVHDRETGQTTRASVGSDGGRPRTAPTTPRSPPTGASSRSRRIRASSRVTPTRPQTSSSATASARRHGWSASTPPRSGASRCRLTSRTSQATAASSRSSPMPRTSSPATATPPPMSSSGIVGAAGRGERASPPKSRRSTAASTARCRPTAATWRSSRTIPTSSPATPWTRGTCFVRDLEKGRTRRASLGRNGQEPNEFSGYAKISPDGRFVTFCSDATNIDADFPDGDVFVRDMRKRRTKLISVGARDTGGPNGNCYSSISRGGRFVTWISGAEGLVPNDANDLDDAFVRGPYRSR